MPMKTEGSSPFLTDANLNMLRSTIGCADGTMDALLIDEVFRLRRELTASEKLLREAEAFVDRHSEPWYTSGQQLLADIRAQLEKANG